MAKYEVGGKKYEVPDDIRGKRLERVLSALARRSQSDRSFGGALSAFGKGVGTGVADLAGMPVDLVSEGLTFAGQGQVPGYPIERPIGGSVQNREALSSIGLAYQNIEEIDPAYRPMARGGETVGASALPAGGPLAKARALGSKPAKGIFAPIVESARQNPGAFAVAEGASAVGAGVGAGVAESVAPDSPTARMYAEIFGGAAPASLLMPLARSLTKKLNQAGTRFGPGGREKAAAGRVQSLLVEGGEDVAQVRGLLEAPSASGARTTAAQKTGSPTLHALEKRLISESHKLGGDIGEQTEQAVVDFHKAVQRAIDAGDPGAMREIAQAQRRWYESLLDARIAQAERAAADASDAIPSGSPVARRDANIEAAGIRDAALKDARTMETELWEKIDKDAVIKPESSIESYNAMRDELLPGESFPAPIEGELKRWAKSLADVGDDVGGNLVLVFGEEAAEEAVEITAGQVLRLRNRLLNEGRKAGAAADFDLRRRLENIADGLLGDLEQVPGDAVTPARDFSRSLNDKFRRTYAGKTLARTREGASMVPPELTLERAMKAGGPEAEVRARGLETAVEPIEGGSAAYLEAARGRPAAMRQAQEKFLRDVAGDLVDPATGRVTPERIRKFRKDNANLLARHPDLSRQIANAERANKTMRDLVPMYERARKIGNQRAAFAKVIHTEDPTVAFSRALNSDAPIEGVSGLFRLAAKGGEQAKSGARAAFLEALWGISTGADGLIDPDVLEGALMRGPLHDAAVKSGVLKPKHLKALDPIIDEIRNFKSAMGSGRALNETLDSESALFDIIARIVGANLAGSSGLAKGAGAPLVLAHAGSQRMRQLLNNLPRQKVTDILIEAVQNPSFMAKLLKKRVTPQGAKAAYRALTEVMYRIGIERPLVASRIPTSQRAQEDKRYPVPIFGVTSDTQ